MDPTILKVSVLADGTILLDGNRVSLQNLADAFEAGSQKGAVVWYYRENAGAAPPPVALQVMKLVVDRRLPVRLSSKPDFSDTITPHKASEVEQTFAAIRERAAQRQLVILRPDGRQLMLPAMDPATAPANAVSAVERLLPSSVKRNVAAIADTSWTMSGAPNMRDAGRAIPFFGMLMGFASIGHSVWIFDGSTAAALAAGCRDADLVIIDSARAEAFAAEWQSAINSVTRTKQMLLYDRATGQLRKP